MKAHQWCRLWLIACTTIVVAHPVICFREDRLRERFFDALFPAQCTAVLALLSGSVAFYNSERMLSRIGFAVWGVSLVYTLFFPYRSFS